MGKTGVNENMSYSQAKIKGNSEGINTDPQSSRNRKCFVLVIIPLIPFMISVLFLVSTAISIYRYVRYNACTETTTGIVTDIKTKSRRSTAGKFKSSHHTVYTYYPVCEFEAEGKTYSFQSKTEARTEIGYTADICYEPDDPENAWLKGSGNAYLICAAITGSIFIIFVIVGAKCVKYIKKP